jgi:hypothetical protein
VDLTREHWHDDVAEILEKIHLERHATRLISRLRTPTNVPGFGIIEQGVNNAAGMLGEIRRGLIGLHVPNDCKQLVHCRVDKFSVLMSEKVTAAVDQIYALGNVIGAVNVSAIHQRMFQEMTQLSSIYIHKK